MSTYIGWRGIEPDDVEAIIEDHREYRKRKEGNK